jgi:hypothetical protein
MHRLIAVKNVGPAENTNPSVNHRAAGEIRLSLAPTYRSGKLRTSCKYLSRRSRDKLAMNLNRPWSKLIQRIGLGRLPNLWRRTWHT